MKTTFLKIVSAIILVFILASFQNKPKTYSNVSSLYDSEDSTFCKLMDHYSVFNERFIVNTLYSWTTKEQVEGLKKSKNVLIKSSSEKYGKSNYDVLLEEKQKAGNAIAGLLLNGLFAKKRFAFPHPWATVRGYPGENYGDQLLRITFRPEAIVGSFISSDDDTLYRFYDLKGKVLNIEYVKQNFDRIAYVYFVNKRKTDKKMVHYRGTMRRRVNVIIRSDGPFPYREYVICNQDMIKEVSVGTDAVKNKIKEDIAFLESMKKYYWLDDDKDGCGPVDEYDQYLNKSVDGDWSSNWLNVSCCVYGKVLALVNEYYDLNKKQLNKTIDVLRSALLSQSESFVITY